MKRPRRKRPNPAHTPAYVPYFEPPKTFRHTRLVLLVGLLLTVLTVALMMHRVELRKMLRAVTAVNVQAAPVPMPANLLPDEAREYQRRQSDQLKSAHRTVGFIHTLGFTFIACLLLCDLIKRCDNELSLIEANFSGYMAMLGIAVIYINCLILLGRFVYYPLFDWLWEALGRQIVDYELTKSSRSGRGSSISAYETGQYFAVIFLVCMGILWSAVDKHRKSDEANRR